MLVEEEEKLSWLDVSIRLNRSYSFIFPILGSSKDQFLNIKACFVGDESRPDLDQHIFILHKYNPKDQEFLKYERMLENHSCFVETYYPDKESMMAVFTVPSHLVSEYDTFLRSKFSRLSGAYKSHIVSFHSVRPSSVLYKIIYRKADLRGGLEERLDEEIFDHEELASLIDLNVEIYREYMKVPS